MAHLQTFRGRSIPLGATALADGVNFALLCRHGTKVRLVLLPVDSDEAIGEIPLDPVKNRTGDHWHVLVAGLPHVFRYGWRVDGPQGGGHRFNLANILLDPSSTAIADGSTDISGYSSGADCAATLACLRALGVAIETPARGQVRISGRGLRGRRGAGRADHARDRIGAGGRDAGATDPAARRARAGQRAGTAASSWTVCSRPGPTPTSRTGTPVKSATKSR